MPFLRDHHESGEAEVDLRLEGRVALGLVERLAVEVDRPAQVVEAHERLCEARDGCGAHQPGSGAFTRLLE